MHSGKCSSQPPSCSKIHKGENGSLVSRNYNEIYESLLNVSKLQLCPEVKFADFKSHTIAYSMTVFVTHRLMLFTGLRDYLYSSTLTVSSFILRAVYHWY